jgi:hypothetical protein
VLVACLEGRLDAAILELYFDSFGTLSDVERQETDRLPVLEPDGY